MGKKNEHLDTIFFDLFGTLINIKKSHNFYGLMLSEMGILKNLNEEKEFVLKHNFDSVEDYFFKRFGRVLNKRLVDEFNCEIESLSLYSGVEDVLTQLKGNGYKVGIISNLASPYKVAVEKLGLDKLVDDCIFSCDEGVIKPEFEIYKIACDRLNSEPIKCLMVGDSFTSDYVGAERAGMHSIHVDRGFNLGFDYQISKLEQLIDKFNL